MYTEQKKRCSSWAIQIGFSFILLRSVVKTSSISQICSERGIAFTEVIAGIVGKPLSHVSYSIIIYGVWSHCSDDSIVNQAMQPTMNEYRF